MTTATLERTYVDPLKRCRCKNGHDWTEANRRIDHRGTWHCRICARECDRRRTERKRLGIAPKQRLAETEPLPQPEAEPVAVPWKVFQLPPSQAHLRGEKALQLVVGAFMARMGHAPSLVICHAANICELGEITVRTQRAGEPILSETEFGAR